MIHFLLYIAQIVLIILLLITIISFVMWVIGNFKNRTPFVTSSNHILNEIEKSMEIKDDSIVYDLGCGDGRVLFYLSDFNEKAKYIGIEDAIFPFVLSKLGLYINKKRTNCDVNIIRTNFFKKDLSDATHVFTYLYPNVMDDLLLKFDKELKPGTRLVSLSFKFTNKQPLLEVDLRRSKYKLGRKLYIYQF